MITCTKKLRLEAGHRLQGHESGCRNVHGHSYVFEITVNANHLDDIGRVIDFGEIKKNVGTWLDANFDHAFIFEKGDPIEKFLDDQSMKKFEFPESPTSENLAKFVFKKAQELLPKHIFVLSVVCHETTTCFSTYSESVPVHTRLRE